MSIASKSGTVFRWWTFAVVVAVVVGAGFAGARVAVAQEDAGYRDFSYAAPSGTSTPFAPTGEKPQSKLWFNDGIWWGSLFDGTPEVGEDPSGQYEIFRFDRATQRWSETNVPLDIRNTSKADTLWDGEHLYVATAVPSSATADPKAYVLRCSYDATTKKYTRDPGFPVVVAPVSGGAGGIEAITLDKDSTGKFWVTYAQRNPRGVHEVYVNRSTSPGGAAWGTPFALPVAGASAVADDDISAVIRYDSDKIGVMWSNQNDGAFYFATHKDGDPDAAWQGETAARCPGCADDHVSLASLEADAAGRVYGAVKTSLDDAATDPEDPLVWLLALGTDDNWETTVFGRVRDNHTRPIVKIDQANRKVYVFATAPCCEGGTIYYKRANLGNDVSFPEGQGTPFMQSSADTRINNVTSSKQNLTAASGLLLLATDDASDFYLHNYMDLGDEVPPDTTITSGPSGAVNSGSASFAFSSTEASSTFECSLDGAAFSGCSSPKSYSGLTNGPHTFEVRATDAAGNTDSTPARRAWSVNATQSKSVPCDTDTKIAQKSSTKNYGSAAINGMDGDEPNGSGKDVYAIIRCDASAVPSNAKVFSASITLNVTNPSTQTYEAYELKRAWTELGATWNVYAKGNPWQTSGAKGSLDRSSAVIGAAAPSATGKYTFALSSSVARNWVADPAVNRGIILADTANTDGVDFSSGEAATSLRPRMDVTYTSP